jgi:hypothetical protein
MHVHSGRVAANVLICFIGDLCPERHRADEADDNTKNESGTPLGWIKMHPHTIAYELFMQREDALLSRGCIGAARGSLRSGGQVDWAHC